MYIIDVRYSGNKNFVLVLTLPSREGSRCSEDHQPAMLQSHFLAIKEDGQDAAIG